MSDKKETRPLVTVCFTDGTRDIQLELPINCGPELPLTVVVLDNPQRTYVRVYGNVYAPRKQ